MDMGPAAATWKSHNMLINSPLARFPRVSAKGNIQPIANRALRRCLRSGIECRIEFEALGEVRRSGGFDDEAIANIERRLRRSLDRRPGRTNGRSEP